MLPAVPPAEVQLVPAVLPAEERAPERPRAVVLADAPAGGVHCGACGSGNAANRHFCRACGAELADAPATLDRTSWWQRVREWVRPARPAPVAGDRPGSWGTAPAEPGRSKWRLRMPRRLSLSALAIPLTLLSLVGFGIGPIRAKATAWGFGVFHQAHAKVVPHYSPVTPLAATATTARPGHEARAAIDRVSATYWAEAAPGTGVGQRLKLTFSAPVNVDRLGVLSGATADAFVRDPRPRVLRITGSDGTLTDIALTDSADFQQRPLVLHGITWLRVQIVTVYPGQTGSAAAIRELELFRRD